MKVIQDALYDTLYANADILAAVGTGIYRGVAPSEATYPFLSYFKTGGGNLNDTPADAVNLVYLVQGVSQVSADEAETLASYIHTALHKAVLTVSGWTNIQTNVTTHLEAVELDSGSGKHTWRAGRFIRIRLSR